MRNKPKKQMRTEQKQLQRDVTARIELNRLRRKIGSLRKSEKAVPWRLLNWTRCRRSEDLEWIVKYAKEQGLGPFQAGGPQTR